MFAGFAERVVGHDSVRWARCTIAMAVEFFGLWLANAYPVSYTHLDVYKRQPLGLAAAVSFLVKLAYVWFTVFAVALLANLCL